MHQFLKRPLLLAALVMTTGCSTVGESRLNPFNWFERSETVEITQVPQEPADPRPLIAEITDLEISSTIGGAILRATGRASQQGSFAAELVRRSSTESLTTLTYDFRIVPPRSATRVSTPRSREITVAVRLSNSELAGITTIQVLGRDGGRSIRRR